MKREDIISKELKRRKLSKRWLAFKMGKNESTVHRWWGAGFTDMQFSHILVTMNGSLTGEGVRFESEDKIIIYKI